MLSAAVLALALAPVADPADDLARVLAGWERRQKAVQTARFELKRDRDAPPPLGKNTHPGSTYYLVAGSGRVLLDVPAGCCRIDSEDHSRNYLTPPRMLHTRWSDRLRPDGMWRAHWFGDEAVIAAADPATANMSLNTGNRVAHRWNSDGLPALWATGRLVSFWDDMTAGPTFGWKPAAGQFTPVGYEVIDGHNCLLLKDAARGETWAVDPDRDGAVVRHRIPDKRTGEHSDTVVRYDHTEHGWLPTGWTHSRAVPGQPADPGTRYQTSARVVNQPIPAAELRFDLFSGQPVRMDDAPYIARADGGLEMEPGYAKQVRRQEFEARMWAMLRSPGTWVAAGLFTLLFAVAVAWRVARSGRRTPAPLDPA